MQVSRIRLSDKTSRLHPRHVAPKRAQAYEPEVPVKVREWIGPALASPDDVDDELEFAARARSGKDRTSLYQEITDNVIAELV